MHVQRLMGLFLTLLALNLFSLAPVLANAAAEAETVDIASAGPSVDTVPDVELPAAAKDEAPVHFKAGVKYDPVKHQWLDRYSNKTVDLGLPGLTGKYGANQLLADSSTSTTTTTTTTGGGINWKKWMIITVMIGGIATAIVVPIYFGVYHHHNNNANTQNNQAAAYYFFHTQTLPIPTVPHGPNPFVPSGGEKPPPQGGALLNLLLGK